MNLQVISNIGTLQTLYIYFHSYGSWVIFHFFISAEKNEEHFFILSFVVIAIDLIPLEK